MRGLSPALGAAPLSRHDAADGADRGGRVPPGPAAGGRGGII